LCLVKEKLNKKRRKMFMMTCFGKWLDLKFFEHEPHMIDYILQKQAHVDDHLYDMPLVYSVEGHSLHFGRPEFSLITGFRFGTVSFGLFTSGEVKILSRVFPNRAGVKVSNLDLLSVIEDEEFVGNCRFDDYKTYKQ
jgi:hypothetical protein